MFQWQYGGFMAFKKVLETFRTIFGTILPRFALFDISAFELSSFDVLALDILSPNLWNRLKSFKTFKNLLGAIHKPLVHVKCWKGGFQAKTTVHRIFFCMIERPRGGVIRNLPKNDHVFFGQPLGTSWKLPLKPLKTLLKVTWNPQNTFKSSPDNLWNALGVP